MSIIETAHRRAVQRLAETRRQLRHMTTETPVILRRAAIILSVQTFADGLTLKMYRGVSTHGSYDGKLWRRDTDQDRCIADVLKWHSSLPPDATIRRCQRDGCGNIVMRSHRAAKFCCVSCQRQAGNAARYQRRKSA